MSAFDTIDKRHRPLEPIKLTPPVPGDHCPDPKCRGIYGWFSTSASSIAGGMLQAGQVLKCSGCGQ